MSDKRTKKQMKDKDLKNEIKSGDQRRQDHAPIEKVKGVIIGILKSNPLQAGELKITLEKNGSNYKYSNDRFYDLLNQMIVSGDLEKKFLVDKPYPVYSVTNESKILAEFNALAFSTRFEKDLFQLNPQLVSEFQNSNHKKTKLDGLLMFLGFRVLGAYLSSQQYENKELKAHWLKSTLDLDKYGSMTLFFDSVINEEHRHLIGKELVANFPENFHVLEKAFTSSNKMKILSDKKVDGMIGIFKNFLDDFDKDEIKK